MSETQRLLDLATAASDGAEVDWSRETERSSGDRERRLVSALGYLAGVLEEHRRLQRGGDDLPPGRNWGPLEILDVIGRGSFGTVYRARDPRLDRPVALKIRPAEPGSAEALVAEGRLMARVRHPNVATVHGADVHDGRVGLWMEFVEGSTLDAILRERGAMGARESIAAGLDLCAALAAVHAAGLVHGDVKPHNVLRDPDGKLVLTDFGAGRDLLGDAAREGGRISGTPLFMAPEVLAGNPKTVRSDLYSLGAVLYHALSARFPVEAESVADLRAAHAEGRARPLRDHRPDLPGLLIAAVTRALARDPGARFGSAGELERALLDALRETARPPQRARKPLLIGAALAAAAALVVAVVSLRVREPAPALTPLAVQASATLFRAGVAADQPLAGGEIVRPGDRLYFAFRSEKPAHVYVVNLDRQGRGYLLFPVPGAQWRNPLQAGVSYRLPGESGWESDSWEVTSSGGKESMVLVASLHPLDRLEAALAGLEPATPEGPGDQGPGGQEVIRGVAKLADASRATGGGAAAVAAALRDLSSSPLQAGEVLVREIVLDNP